MVKLVDFLVENDVNFRKSRLPSLYSDFSSLRNLNPDGYEANLFAWNEALARLAAEGLLPHRFIVHSGESLRTSLAHREYGKPQSLGMVIRDSATRKALVQLRLFEESTSPVDRLMSWGSFPWNIVAWSTHRLGLFTSSGEGEIVPDKYVIMRNLEAASTQVAKKIDKDTRSRSKYDRVMKQDMFLSEYASSSVGNQPLTVEDGQVLMRFLSRDKGIIAWDGSTVRIRAEGENRVITTEDITIGWNKELMMHLKHQAIVLAQKIKDLDEEARSAVLSKNRIKALACLKSKKLAENSLAHRYTTILSLEDMASKIQQASDQVEFVQLMELATGTLKNLNQQLGGAERVDAVITKMREQANATDEVAAILAESPGNVVDEMELDDELEALEKAERDKVEQEQEVAEALATLGNLPAVPTDPVSERTKTKSPTTETGIERLALGN